jgi:tRNA-(ms[2]io[6]A)-hydroxylase
LKLEVERFKVLSENIQDEELAVFYRDLMESEAGHYTTFITYARKYGTGIDEKTLERMDR